MPRRRALPPATPTSAPAEPPRRRPASQPPAGASALETAVEAMAARLERYGYSVRGADPIETRHNLERLRRERPDLFGLMG